MTQTLMIAVTIDRRARVYADIDYLLNQGNDVTLLTLNLDTWPDLDPRVEVVQLRPAELKHPVPAIEEFLLFKGPRRSFRLAKRMVSDSEVMVSRIDRVQRAWMRRARHAHRSYWNPVYRPLRPWVLWRSSRKHILPELDLSRYDTVVVADAQAIPLGWHLSHDYGHGNVQFQVARRPSEQRTDLSNVDTLATGDRP
jgi:hypothetical protein